MLFLRSFVSFLLAGSSIVEQLAGLNGLNVFSSNVASIQEDENVGSDTTDTVSRTLVSPPRGDNEELLRILSRSGSSTSTMSSATVEKLNTGQRLNRKERREVAKAEHDKYIELRRQGVDEVSNTQEAATLRNYRLRNYKRSGLFFLWKYESPLSSILYPGSTPENYMPGEQVYLSDDLIRSKTTSIKYEYEDLVGECPFLYPLQKRNYGYIGSELLGRRYNLAPYKIIVKRDQPCTPLCMVKIGKKKREWMKRLIDRHYRIHLTLDSLPVLMRSREFNYAIRGYPIGFKSHPDIGFMSLPYKVSSNREYFVFNHFKFTITYHEDPVQFDGIRITGFDVHPVSFDHTLAGNGDNIDDSTCQGFDVENNPNTYLSLYKQEYSDLNILYTYDVQWIANDLPWSGRWDVYVLQDGPHPGVHRFAMVNSMMIVLFLACVIASIVIRILRQEGSVNVMVGKCGQMIQPLLHRDDLSMDDRLDDIGWKLIHGDVFRPPRYSPTWLSAMVGTGVQLVVAFFVTLLRCNFGKIQQSQGSLLAALIPSYALCGGPVAGYVSARIYKFIHSNAATVHNHKNKGDWKINATIVASVLPGSSLVVLVILNMILSVYGATTVTTSAMCTLLVYWLFVSAPLVFLGCYVGNKVAVIEVPTNTNQTPRAVPADRCGNPIFSLSRHPTLIMFGGGLLIFASFCTDLGHHMRAVWLDQIYYDTRVLLTTIAMLSSISCEVSIILCYLQLCREDHRWWWRSFLNCATSGVYAFAYGTWFLLRELEITGLVSLLVYLMYIAMISVSLALYCGAIGFLSSFLFTRMIYGIPEFKLVDEDYQLTGIQWIMSENDG